MKAGICRLICCGALCLITAATTTAQYLLRPPDDVHKRIGSSGLPPQGAAKANYRIPGKSTAQYTAEDWGHLVDSVFGPGQGATAQLAIFDSLWNLVDKYWGGFPNLPLNWDSVRTAYRPLIGSGLSRGRFYALISRMVSALEEHHTAAGEYFIDTVYGNSAFQHKAGVPLLIIGSGMLDMLGAPVTPTADSSGLVYRVDPANPLGLQPGDLVLGYDRVPWKRLYEQLVTAEVPLSQLYGARGSTPESHMHDVICGVGQNWGLFDTIDIVKYSTGDTVHLSTAPLAAVAPSKTASDQVPIAGVPLPEELALHPSVSSGIVAGTNIGYVYVWDWASLSGGTAFTAAITDLCVNQKVDGLILDFRMNWGGSWGYANGGLSRLFNFDATKKILEAVRTGTSDHMAFTIQASPRSTDIPFIPSSLPYDRPIAVLIGPSCLSSGDYVAFFMRFHPMVRLFGKATNGAFVAGGTITGGLPSSYLYGFRTGDAYSAVPGEGHLIHRGVQPDERVWLTRDGVARGEDDVVKRALSWITTLSYAHDAKLNKSVVSKDGDSVLVTATVANPGNHTLAVSAIIRDTSGSAADSVLLLNDGLHGDGAAGDSVYGGSLRTPRGEGFFGITLRTDDKTAGTYRRYPDLRLVTSAGPVVVAGYSFSTADTTAAPGKTLFYRVTLQNTGSSVRIPRVTAKVRALDTTVILPVVEYPYGDLAPGQSSAGSGIYRVRYSSTRPGNYPVEFLVDIFSNGVLFWSGNFTDLVTGVEHADAALPAAYGLSQNFPNPFNPGTTIRYELPKSSMVRLSVYDALGREVSVLVNERKGAGSYEVEFDGSNLASGMYFYRIQAGGFISTKRMLVVK